MLQSDSVIHIIILFIHVVFHYGLSQDTEYSSLCSTVEPYYLSILYITVWIYELIFSCRLQSPFRSDTIEDGHSILRVGLSTFSLLLTCSYSHCLSCS